MPKGSLTSFGGPFHAGSHLRNTALNSQKNELGVSSRATSHILSDVINPGIISQLYSKTSRSESLSLRLCYSKPMPPKCTLQFITHVGAILPGKSYGENIKRNEQNKKRLSPTIDFHFTNSCSFNFHQIQISLLLRLRQRNLY